MVFIRKKVIAVSAALLFFLIANCSLRCKLIVNGIPISGTYSFLEADSCINASAEAAEEIVRGAAPEPRIRHRICLVPPWNADSVSEGADGILTASGGVQSVAGVYVDSEFFGCAADVDIMRSRLARNVISQKPNAAVTGDYSLNVLVKPVYTYTGRELLPYDDMVLLVSGAAPVMYYDAAGERA